MRYRDRQDAGRQLADELAAYANRSDVIVLALPRGGVPVGAAVADRLHAPLDVWLVRKLGVPGYPELAMGAIAAGGIEVLNHDVLESLQIPQAQVAPVAARERIELERRAQAFRGDRALPDVRGRVVILVDDGLATGATMEAAILAVRTLAPSAIVVAVPVGAAETCDRLRRLADVLVCPQTPFAFHAVGQWYEDFSETTDDEVRRLLDAAAERSADSAVGR
jgi:predicted phosphoribosyltransferase